MKNMKFAAAAIALSALSFGAFAAQPVTSAQAESMNKIGVVSAEGATTLDGLEAKLAECHCFNPVRSFNTLALPVHATGRAFFCLPLRLPALSHLCQALFKRRNGAGGHKTAGQLNSQ